VASPGAQRRTLAAAHLQAAAFLPVRISDWAFQICRLPTPPSWHTGAREVVSQFEKRPVLPGTLLTWVCRRDTGYLDVAQDALLLSSA
jgi:hypothetical protein